MVQALQRTATSGPALIRLLARLAQTDVAGPSQSLSDRLSDWLGWTDAITLSGALNAAPPAHARTAGGDAGAEADAKAACERVRTTLTRAIATATRAPSAQPRSSAGLPRSPSAQPGSPAGQSNSPSAPSEPPPPDYADFRQRYLLLQQTMESEIGELRQKLRVLLAATTPGMARLATVDAVMERSLGVRERALFASVPTLLGAHFERLRDAQQRGADDAPMPPAGAWLRTFLGDMQSVLLAELEARFQPVEGLLAALRTR
jgi:hypothetical protein